MDLPAARNITTNEIRDNLIFALTAYIPLGLVVICGNAFVLIVIRRTPSLQEPQFTLLASLALVDLLTGIIGVPMCVWGLVTQGSLHLPNINDCQVQYIPFKTFAMTSFLHLVFITTDRYISIAKSLRYGQIVTPSRVHRAIAISWIIGCMYSSVLFLWKNKRIEGIFLCYTMNPQGIAVQSYLALILVPTCVILMIMMYFRMFMVARKHINTIGPTSQNTVGTQTTVHKKFKAAKTCALIVSVFVVAYLPSSIRGVIFIFVQRSDIYWFDLMSGVLVCMSSAVNPFIYVFRHKQFSSALPVRRLLRNITNGD
ncbi:trace amine-associated receptor 7c-like [Anneissia japonica]|uniref:trace amine-associated receptor 7c-like n=1 Tax=Anneissia japonica TaxID=1529436 RepID=UPI001425787D|nr:trace amine-associated receptor 7c-like [Anneissia japonica]